VCRVVSCRVVCCAVDSASLPHTHDTVAPSSDQLSIPHVPRHCLLLRLMIHCLPLPTCLSPLLCWHCSGVLQAKGAVLSEKIFLASVGFFTSSTTQSSPNGIHHNTYESHITLSHMTSTRWNTCNVDHMLHRLGSRASHHCNVAYRT
jgi:hypothetical protein